MRGYWRQPAVSCFMATPAAMLWLPMPAMGKPCGTFPPTEKTRPRRSLTRWMESSLLGWRSARIFSAFLCLEGTETYEQTFLETRISTSVVGDRNGKRGSAFGVAHGGGAYPGEWTL